MDLYITQNSYYFVHRHFQRFFENEHSHIIYVKESGRGQFRKYYEIITNMGLINTLFAIFLESIYFILLSKKQKKLTVHNMSDLNLNVFLEKKLKTGKYKRVFSIGCPCIINPNLQRKYGINIYNLHGGIIPFQKGRFSPIKGLKKGHKVLGASLYLISDIFDEGSLISQDYFNVANENIIGNYNRVLILSSDLLDAFLRNELREVPADILEELAECNQ